MKSTFKIILTSVVIFLACIAGCKKEKSATDDAAIFNEGLLNIINTNQPTKHTVTVSASTGGSIIGANTRLRFSPNAFTTVGGSAVTGNVLVEIQEFYTKAQMVLGNKVTMDDSLPLESRGEVYINATQNGQQLSVKPGYAIIQFEATSITDYMALFKGTTSGTLGDISWTIVDSTIIDSSYNVNSYTLPIQTSSANTTIPPPDDTIPVPIIIIDPMATIYDTLYTYPFGGSNSGSNNGSFGGWFNCDAFGGGWSVPRTNLTINLPVGYDNSSTVLYVVFSNANTVIRGTPINTSGFMCYSVPVGRQATIVALNYHNEGWYSSFTPITITANHVELLTFSPTTIADYTAQVNVL